MREDRAGGWAYSKASPPSRWDPLMSVLGGHNTENIIGNSGPYRLEIEHHSFSTTGKSCTKTGLFALATLLTVDADARTHDQHMVLPNAPHQMRSMSIHGQHPSQRDAKVQNRHNELQETADLLRSESLLGNLELYHLITMGVYRSRPTSISTIPQDEATRPSRSMTTEGLGMLAAQIPSP